MALSAAQWKAEGEELNICLPDSANMDMREAEECIRETGRRIFGGDFNYKVTLTENAGAHPESAEEYKRSREELERTRAVKREAAAAAPAAAPAEPAAEPAAGREAGKRQQQRANPDRIDGPEIQDKPRPIQYPN